MQPAVAYSHLNVIYASPASQEQINSLTTSLLARGAFQVNAATRVQLTASAQILSPLSHKWQVVSTNNELSGLLATLYGTHQVLSDNCATTTAALHVFRSLSPRYAVKAGATWQHAHYSCGSISANTVTAQVAFIF